MSQLRPSTSTDPVSRDAVDFAALFHPDRRVALHAGDLERAGPADELDGADVLDLDFTPAMRDVDFSGNLPERRFAARALHLQA